MKSIPTNTPYAGPNRLPREQPTATALARRDIEIINRNADRLNREAADTLEYRTLPLTGPLNPLPSPPPSTAP